MKYYFTKGGEGKYIRCSKCGIVRNLEEAPECPTCQHPRRPGSFVQMPRERKWIKSGKLVLDGDAGPGV